MRNARMLVVLGMLLFVALVSVHASGAPRLLTYQGKLTNASGVALDGSQDITFKLYTTETGGTAMWTEAHTGSDAVTVTNGLFDVELGTISPLNIAFDDTYWIELQIGTETLSPRERLVAVPYAFRAIVADTAMVVGSGAVQTDGTSITGDGTSSHPLSAVLGNSIESGEITNGTIVNADISASAAIDWSKINHPALDNYQYWTATDGSNNTNVNSTGSLTFAGTGGASVTISSGTVTIDASSAGDGNNYTTGISFSGTATKTLTLTRNGLADLTASFTDNNTTYSAGDGLDLTGTTFSVDVTDIIGTGLSEDASNNLVVQYGSASGTAVEGDKQITITAGTGLSGGGTITLGAGGSVTLNNTGDLSSSNEIQTESWNGSGSQYLLDLSSTDDDAAVRAGSGISFTLIGDTLRINNTGDLSSSNELQTINANNGLTGGGSGLTVGLAVGEGDGINVAADAVSVEVGTGLQITGTAPNRPLSVKYGSASGTAVEGNKQITITAGTGLSGGGTITLGSGGSVTLTNNDRGSSQSIFKQIQNSSGVTQFSAGSNNDYLQFAGSGGASVSFDAANHRITIDASSAGDGNNYTTGISFSGTATKTLTLTRNGLADLTASFTDNNTTYSAGNGISLSGTQFSVAGNNGLTQDADGLSVGAGNGITVAADNVSVHPADGTIDVSASGVKIGLGAAKATSTSYKVYRNY